MNFKLLALTAAILATGFVSGCSSNNKSNNDVAGNETDCAELGTCDRPEHYGFANAEGDEPLFYDGQIVRHMLIEDMKTAIGSLKEDASVNVAELLNGYMLGKPDAVSTFTLANTQIEPTNDAGVLTYDAVATDKNLRSKIAGGFRGEDDVVYGEKDALLDDMFFGWSEGIGTNDRPIDLVNHFFSNIHNLATDGDVVLVPTAEGDVAVNAVYVDGFGRDFQQLTQKFLLMAVTFSQGTADYLQSNFATEVTTGSGDLAATEYSTAEHHWDEGFGYFGAARDYPAYEDQQIADGATIDTDNSGTIDIRSEFNWGNSTNCAKRDLATVGNSNPTDFTKEAFDAFVAGRQILRDASAAGVLTDEAKTQLDIHVKTATVAWEKCIAATVVHYINDTINDMANYNADGTFASVGDFTTVAKHWSEMKGFALGLQFNPLSPFRTSDDVNMMDLQMVLAWMGDAPVLADGTQLGMMYDGGVDAYQSNLLQARGILQKAYNFDEENVSGW